MPTRPTFLDDHVLRVGAIEFYFDYPLRRNATGRLPVVKHRGLVERSITLADELRPRNMVELGISQGGSTALWSELVQPEKLVAVELEPEPVEVLQTYIDQHGLADRVRPYYGVDQADRERLEQIVDDEFGSTPLDLVVDDASHRYAETRASFEVLFPRLRPGGVYVIEDWPFGHRIADTVKAALTDASAPGYAQAMQRLTASLEARAAGENDAETPLTRLAVELVIARASSGDLFRSVAAEAFWIVVTKGDDPTGPGPFRLADHVNDHDGYLTV